MARICHRKVRVSALCIALHVARPSGTEFCYKIRASGSNYDLRRLQRIFVGNFSLKDRKLSFQYAKLWLIYYDEYLNLASKVVQIRAVLMPVPSPDKWGWFQQEGLPAKNLAKYVQCVSYLTLYRISRGPG